MTMTASLRRRHREQETYRPFTLTVDLQAPRIVISHRHISTATAQGASAKNDRATRLVTLEGARARAALPALLELLHRSGYSLPRLEEKGRGRFRLSEGPGARAALMLRALAPIQKPSRASLVRAGILAMVDEEIFYWYAKASLDRGRASRRSQNALKALRILLAGE
jgi:hypothetical protein